MIANIEKNRIINGLTDRMNIYNIALSDENLKKANEFLIDNKNQAGVIEIEPGKLQYMILEEGNG